MNLMKLIWNTLLFYLFEYKLSTSDTVPSFGEILVMPEDYNRMYAITDYWLSFHTHVKGNVIQYRCTYCNHDNCDCRYVADSGENIKIQVSM